MREVDDRFNKGDLVLVKQYSYYDLSNAFVDKSGYSGYSGDILLPNESVEELLSKENVCLGIITSKDIISWEPEAEAWMASTVADPYVLVQFRVYCFGINGSVRARLVDSTEIRLLSKGEIGRGIEESLENLKNNKQQ